MSRRGSMFVAIGILLSRIAGLVRQRILAHFLGITDDADALNAAFRVPNFLQNLFGEGALSASFIPAYSKLLARGEVEAARRLAGATLSLLTLLVSVIVLVGELASPALVSLLAGGYTGEKRALTEQLVRILFPGAGLLVMSAWCLGVLNSHRKFLLSYASPVVWNLAIIVSILFFSGMHDRNSVVIAASWGAVVGSALQVLVQLPVIRAVGGPITLQGWRKVEGVGTVLRAFFPNLISRGANQISAFIDLQIATHLSTGALAAIANAQVLYTLPVSLFGMAVSAAELPEMAREQGDEASIAKALRQRLSGATQRMAYYVIPSAVGFLCLGGVIAGAVFQGGKFQAEDANYVWLVLAGSATGLLASTLGRLYASTFYALHDTRTPLRCGIVRVVLTGILGVLAALVLPGMLGLEPKWGAAGLTASAGIAGWIEFALLRRELCRRLGHFNLEMTELAKLWVAAIVAAVVSTGARLLLPVTWGPLPLALVVVPLNALTYLAITMRLDIPEAAVLRRRVTALAPARFRPR